MMSLFGKKKEAKAPSTADTLALLAENIALLEKKQEHLQGKISHETATARKNASTNKRAALAALKRKKLYENQCNKLQDTIVTLQQQEIALQNLATNVEILTTMNQVKGGFIFIISSECALLTLSLRHDEGSHQEYDCGRRGPDHGRRARPGEKDKRDKEGGKELKKRKH